MPIPRQVSSKSVLTASTEAVHPVAQKLERLSMQSLVDLFIREESQVQKALFSERKKIAQAVELVEKSLKKGGRLLYVGAGTSGRLGVLDASEIPPTFGLPSDRVLGLIAGGKKAVFRSQEGAEDQESGSWKDLKKRRIGSNDVVCGIAASGRTPYVIGALRFAKKQKTKTIFLTCNPRRATRVAVDVSIDLPTGPEVIAGSTRLKAGTATKLVLNMLTSISMIRLGRVKQGRMTHLQSNNLKLQERAIQNVMALAGVNRKQAQKALVSNHWRISVALKSF